MEVKKKPRENISTMLRRFTKKVRKSGILVDAKKSMFQDKKLSKGERRRMALERQRKKREKERLKKLGRL